MMENPESIMRFLEKVRKEYQGEGRLFEIFQNCYTNTLNKTVKKKEDGSTYVITGDIPAMWLRDSAVQLRPYLIPAREDKELAELIAGLVRRQFACICLDPYANAFNEEANGACWEKDYEDQSPWVWEKKFEVDSLCYPLQLAWLIWKETGLTSQFDEAFRRGAGKILEVFRIEQRHETDSPYRFVRKNTIYKDTLSRDGKGAYTRPDTGMVWSGFRPSDDACTYGYLIPSNMFASVAMGYLEEIARDVLKDPELAGRAGRMKREIRNGIENYGIVRTEEFGEIYAYETDGYGEFCLMDDANVPSLLAMDYLGYRPGNPKAAENTRKFLLSGANPYYFKGRAAAGIGSPHTPSSYIWHISMAVQGLTSPKPEEKKRILKAMADTDGGKGLMHEGFCCEEPSRYTREWFSWANAMYAELFLDCLGFRVGNR